MGASRIRRGGLDLGRFAVVLASAMIGLNMAACVPPAGAGTSIVAPTDGAPTDDLAASTPVETEPVADPSTVADASPEATSEPLPSEAPRPSFSLDGTGFNFGKLLVGPPAISTVRLTNSGPVAFTVSLDLGGGVFTAMPCTQRTVDPGKVCDISLFFSPGARGTYSATLTIIGATANAEQRTEFALSGTVIIPAVANVQSSLAFPTQSVNTANKMSLWIGNGGDQDLQVLSMVVQEQGASPYSANGCVGARIAGGDGCSVDVTFIPTEAGTAIAILAIQTNVGLSQVMLSGFGG